MKLSAKEAGSWQSFVHNYCNYSHLHCQLKLAQLRSFSHFLYSVLSVLMLFLFVLYHITFSSYHTLICMWVFTPCNAPTFLLLKERYNMCWEWIWMYLFLEWVYYRVKNRSNFAFGLSSSNTGVMHVNCNKFRWVSMVLPAWTGRHKIGCWWKSMWGC